MVRSIWKGVYIGKELRDYSKIKNDKIVTTERSSVIIPYFLNKTIYIYNGKKYIGLKVTEKTLGRKLGEYSFTKKTAVYKDTGKKKKK